MGSYFVQVFVQYTKHADVPCHHLFSALDIALAISLFCDYKTTAAHHRRSQACLGGGSRICYFAKRPIHNGDVVQAGLQDVIDWMLPNCNQQVLDNFCVTTTAGEKPMSAPVIDWFLHCVDEANACAFVNNIRAFM